MSSVTKFVLLFTGLCSLSFSSGNDGSCGFKNTAFKADEFVMMKVFYSTLGMYIGAGEATFSTSLERFNGKMVYHFIGEGKHIIGTDTVTITVITMISPAHTCCPPSENSLLFPSSDTLHSLPCLIHLHTLMYVFGCTYFPQSLKFFDIETSFIYKLNMARQNHIDHTRPRYQLELLDILKSNKKMQEVSGFNSIHSNLNTCLSAIH